MVPAYIKDSKVVLACIAGSEVVLAYIASCEVSPIGSCYSKPTGFDCSSRHDCPLKYFTFIKLLSQP